MQTVLDLYKVDIASIPNTHDRQAARRYWLRAVIETLMDRAITAPAPPTRRTAKPEIITERFKPFWQSQSDNDLFELLDYLSPYFRRLENRGQPL